MWSDLGEWRAGLGDTLAFEFITLKGGSIVVMTDSKPSAKYGWSSGWDSALRELILSAENRRYSMYRAPYSGLDEEAEELVEHRDGNVVSIDGADSFF